MTQIILIIDQLFDLKTTPNTHIHTFNKSYKENE